MAVRDECAAAREENSAKVYGRSFSRATNSLEKLPNTPVWHDNLPRLKSSGRERTAMVDTWRTGENSACGL